MPRGSPPRSPAASLLPTATAPASLGRVLMRRRRLRRAFLASLAVACVFNAFWATPALYRAWKGRGSEAGSFAAPDEAPAVGRNAQPSAAALAREQAGSAADQTVAAALDASQALGSAAGALKHGVTAAGKAAGAAAIVAAPVAVQAAQAVGGAAKEAAGAVGGAAKEAAGAAKDAAVRLVLPSNASEPTAAKANATQMAEPARRLAELTPPLVDAASNDSCAQSLSLKKVALLFLTKGELHHERAWHAWFESAAGLLPAKALQAELCGNASSRDSGQQEWQAVQSACLPEPPLADGAAASGAALAAAATGRPLGAAAVGRQAEAASVGAQLPCPLQKQHLFSVYIHAPPDFQGYPAGSLWESRLIPRRLATGWGDISLVEATRNLLWEAFRDPLNERFVLLSESDIPLYDPLTFWAQLMAEEKSRINACMKGWPTRPLSKRRWSWRMFMPTLKLVHWRKSSQWFGLRRRHVEVILQDTAVFRKFEEHCRGELWDRDYQRNRDCYSDEHYMPTLLATKGLGPETSCCFDGIVAVDWTAGGAHPKSYKFFEVHAAQVRKMRGEARGCQAGDAIADAHRMFVTKARAFGMGSTDGTSGRAASPAQWRQQLCNETLAGPLPAYEHPLALNCPLTARKFKKLTVRAVARLFGDCNSGLHLLGPSCRRRS